MHTSDDGTYTVSLTVTDDDGETDTANATITVIVTNRAPVASFTESAETISSGESIHFNASASHDPDGTLLLTHGTSETEPQQRA